MSTLSGAIVEMRDSYGIIDSFVRPQYAVNVALVYQSSRL